MNNRCRGTLIGLAVGDALSATDEFRRPGSFTAVSVDSDGRPLRLNVGEWTDDTSMAVADSIDTTGRNLNDHAGAYWGNSGISEKVWLDVARMDMLQMTMGGLLAKVDSP